jgi:hypothetical protein
MELADAIKKTKEAMEIVGTIRNTDISEEQYAALLIMYEVTDYIVKDAEEKLEKTNEG